VLLQESGDCIYPTNKIDAAMTVVLQEKQTPYARTQPKVEAWRIEGGNTFHIWFHRIHELCVDILEACEKILYADSSLQCT